MTKHTFRVDWSEEDQEYIGLCVEYPSLSHLDKEPRTALKGIIDLVEDVVKDIFEKGAKYEKHS